MPTYWSAWCGCPTPSSEIVLTEDGQAVDGRYAGFTMSQHEQCAVEVAVQVAAATGGEASVMSAGRRGRR